MTFEELASLRRKTEAVAKFLEERLIGYLDTLKPLFTLEQLSGQSTGPMRDKFLQQMKESYRRLALEPLNLPREFDDDWVKLIGNRIELHRWEYMHEAQGSGGKKAIKIASPVRWTVTYSCGCTPFEFHQIIAGKQTRRTDEVTRFVINALVLQLAVARNAGFAALFKDLRFDLRPEIIADCGNVPILTATSLLPSFRPGDDLIVAATEFSGVPAFIELIEIEGAKSIQDPWKQKVDELLN